ncbi:Poly(A) RNA polymerase protein cid1 [Madurella mycetomatis]|uniref:polynucleotide adenylyltransferase n=1 Tax=Madurella mycetomatis TaxID=100816 RepID=A0A175W973_9PEZI|nr:Poly(A) RNA polymerase protein cid1 [Madurella mycetomatis]
MAAGQAGGAPLEERLRSLILSNSQEQSPDHEPTLPPPPAQGVTRAGQDGPVNPSLPPSNGAASASSRPPRKRPNQAQRRQMSAQLSIPIDTRPQFPQTARSYASPPAHPSQQHGGGGGGGGGGGHNRAQRPHSATFRPPSRGNTTPNAPLTGGPSQSQRRHQPSLSYHGPMPTPDRLDWRQPQMQHGDPRAAYHTPALSFDGPSPMHPRHGTPGLYSPGRQYHVRPEEMKAQVELLEGLCHTIIADAEIEPADIVEKEAFRAMIENVARSAITKYERQNGFRDFPPESVQLKCFGSLSSGFATKAADMDLGLLSPLSRIQPDAPGSPIPRLVEKAFLDIGLGARLLSRTRVPIIKVCEKPPEALRLALLEERAKWERGAKEESEDDEPHEEPDVHPAEDSQPQDGSLSREQRLHSLKQGETQNLSNYYGAAKRLLRKLGGRDLTNSNSAEFKQEDFKFLNEFCLAFVDGLADSKLRERLLSYRSLNRYDLTSQSNFRSLLGVFTQIEGESLAMTWDSRSIKEKNESREQLALNHVRAWRDLRNTADYGQDPLGYQKQLQFAAEQLKKVPSIQVLFLEQGQHEPAAKYCSRALRLLLELGGHDTHSSTDPISATVTQHYVNGIWSHVVREDVAKFAQPYGTVGFRAVTRRHKSLQLAHEYETCLERGVYPEETAAKVRRYVELLRSPMAKFPSADPLLDIVVPLPQDTAPLLSEIRLLGDPSSMSPNQPRDPYHNRLEFPKSGVGVQCDINFSAHLALQNTLLLRCYSHCDSRVRPLVLFVKHWAKVRRINSPYRGTLSSYGYVLMMLHYLVNIAQPFVCPNLQQLAPPRDPRLAGAQEEGTVMCKGRNVQFWRDEAEIQRLARGNALTQNREPVGQLLRGFFEYYAQGNMMSTVPCRGFDWGRDVISLRTHGGLLSKQKKGWTGAKTVIEIKAGVPPPAGNTPELDGGNATAAGVSEQQQQQQHSSPPASTKEVREVRYRYLFAIEDPFEIDHNVARTVTHTGIVNIRDEFRRAWRIIRNAGKGGSGGRQEDLLEDVAAAEEAREKEQFAQLLDELHGLEEAQQGAGREGDGCFEGVDKDVAV